MLCRPRRSARRTIHHCDRRLKGCRRDRPRCSAQRVPSGAARRAISASPACASRPSCQFVADASLVSSGKSPPPFRASRLAEEGRFAIVTSVELEDATGVLLCSLVSQPGRRTERCDGEMVWSWHRGADAKPVGMMIRWRRGQDSRSPGRAPITRSNRRAGKAGYWAEPVVLPRAYLLHADRGYQSIPGLPCASSLRERFSRDDNSGGVRRETPQPCSLFEAYNRRRAMPRSKRAGHGDLRPVTNPSAAFAALLQSDLPRR